MFLAIINDTYAVVKEEVNSKPAEFNMSDFFSTGVNNVKGSLGIQDRYIILVLSIENDLVSIIQFLNRK